MTSSVQYILKTTLDYPVMTLDNMLPREEKRNFWVGENYAKACLIKS